MGRDVDDIVGPGHDMDVAILVHDAGVARVHPLAIEPAQVALVEALLVLPEGPERRRGERQRQDDVAHLAARHLVALVVHDPHVEPRHRLARRAGLDIERRVVPYRCPPIAPGVRDERDARDGGPRLGAPPVVDDAGVRGRVLAQQLLVHGDDRGLRALTSQEERLEGPEPAAPADRAEARVFRIVLADRTQRRRGREHGIDFVLVH